MFFDCFMKNVTDATNKKIQKLTAQPNIIFRLVIIRSLKIRWKTNFSQLEKYVYNQ